MNFMCINKLHQDKHVNFRKEDNFGIEAQFWLNRQTEYDLRVMKRKIWSDIERRVIPIEDIGDSLQHSAGA